MRLAVASSIVRHEAERPSPVGRHAAVRLLCVGLLERGWKMKRGPAFTADLVCGSILDAVFIA